MRLSSHWVAALGACAILITGCAGGGGAGGAGQGDPFAESMGFLLGTLIGGGLTGAYSGGYSSGYYVPSHSGAYYPPTYGGDSYVEQMNNQSQAGLDSHAASSGLPCEWYIQQAKGNVAALPSWCK